MTAHYFEPCWSIYLWFYLSLRALFIKLWQGILMNDVRICKICPIRCRGGGGGGHWIYILTVIAFLFCLKKKNCLLHAQALTHYSPILYFAPILPTYMYLPSFGRRGGGGVEWHSASCPYPDLMHTKWWWKTSKLMVFQGTDMNFIE